MCCLVNSNTFLFGYPHRFDIVLLQVYCVNGQIGLNDMFFRLIVLFAHHDYLPDLD